MTENIFTNYSLCFHSPPMDVILLFCKMTKELKVMIIIIIFINILIIKVCIIVMTTTDNTDSKLKI